jgi:HAMP domain-containing protein
MRLSVKLAALCAAAAILPLLVALLVVLSQLSAHAHRQASESMQREARAAAAIADKRMSELRSAAQRLADDIANRALTNADSAKGTQAATPQARIQDMLPRALQDYGLDFALVADTQGRVIARHNDVPQPAETIAGSEYTNHLAESAVSRNNAFAAAAVERGAQLKTLGLDLRVQVKMTNGATLDDALMIEAAAPIQGGGRLVGVVLIGQMLNNDWKPRPGATALQSPLVAEIRQTLYHDAQTDAGAVAALQNMVVTSSVTGSSGSEAALIGVPCDAGQSEGSLAQSDERYSVAWQPLKSVSGEEVGYVGVARNAQALAGATAAARAALLVIALLALVAAGAGGFFYGRALGLRLDSLNEAVTRWGVGELSSPAKDREPMIGWAAALAARDEINRLAASLEQMRESFRQAIDRLRKRDK